MKTNFFIAVKLTMLCLVFFSGIYTFIVYGIAQFTPNHGKGKIIQHVDDITPHEDQHLNNGTQSYFENIGQCFSEDKYFYSRPSAVNYNAAGSAGSNKAPSNPDYLAQVKARIDTFLVHNPDVRQSEIPSDLVTASGSGLDPHISVQAALVQIKRISKIQGIAEANLKQLIISNTEPPLLGLFGTEKINVLKLNLSLDQLN